MTPETHVPKRSDIGKLLRQAPQAQNRYNHVEQVLRNKWNMDEEAIQKIMSDLDSYRL